MIYFEVRPPEWACRRFPVDKTIGPYEKLAGDGTFEIGRVDVAQQEITKQSGS